MVTQLRPTFYIKQGDTRPHLDVALADDEGHRVNLTNGTVSFSMRNVADDSTVVNEVSSTILVARRGEVRHEWASTHTENAGIFEGEFKFNDANNRTQRFPTEGFLSIIVVESVT